MVFSFFRKNPEESPKAKSRVPEAVNPAAGTRPPVTPTAQSVAPKTIAPAQQPTITPKSTAAPPPPPPSEVEVNTVWGAVDSAEMYSAVEEAAILYASNYSDQAAALLLDFIKNHADRKELQPWMMLFDIYQAQGKKPQFDELALEFVVKFERSAPTWDDAKVPGAIKAEKPKTGGGAAVEGYVALTGILQGDKDSLFQNLEQVAQKGAGLRLDFARLEGLEASGSRRLVETLQGLKKSGKKITPISVPHVTDLLKSLIGKGSGDEQAHWQLLLNLYQCQGMETEFEDLAVEYAITFEVSPPSWEAMPQCRQPVSVEATATATDERPQDENTFFMSGVIASDNAQQLQELANFAVSRSEVYLDMAGVSRVDFGSIGDFVGVLVRLNGNGKKLFIRNANEMIRALFGVMGVEQFASILRRKAG